MSELSFPNVFSKENLSLLNSHQLDEISTDINKIVLTRKSKENLKEYIKNLSEDEASKELIEIINLMTVIDANNQTFVGSSLRDATFTFKNPKTEKIEKILLEWTTSVWTKHGTQWTNDTVNLYTIDESGTKTTIYEIVGCKTDFENQNEENKFEEICEWMMERGISEDNVEESVKTFIKTLMQGFQPCYIDFLDTIWEEFY